MPDSVHRRGVAPGVRADGACGRWCAPALVACFAGIAVQIPFSRVDGVFTGFAVPLLGGADIAWRSPA